eukprot:15479162-Alexandrium_andersonii.AAC.1
MVWTRNATPCPEGIVVGVALGREDVGENPGRPGAAAARKGGVPAMTEGHRLRGLPCGLWHGD